MSSPAIVTGDLTRSAQLSRTSDGTPVVNLTLAENSRRQVEGEWIDGPTTYTDPPGSDLPGGTDRLPVGGHPLQDVVEGDHGVDDVRSLVEHHGFGVLPHGRVGDLRAGGLTGAGQLVEDLGRPDHRQVCGLAQPQDLLLQRLIIDVPRAEPQMHLDAAHAGFATEGLALVVPSDPTALVGLGPRITRRR